MTEFALDFLKAMRYEHWLRFYFAGDPEAGDDAPDGAEDESMDAVFSVPDGMRAVSAAQEPELFPILESIDGMDVSMEASRDAIFAWLGKRHDMEPGSSSFEQAMSSLAADQEFMKDLDMFHGWVQNLADGVIDLKGNALPPSAQPDEHVVPFGEWEKSFRFWQSIQKTTMLR